jgi:heme A synthase
MSEAPATNLWASRVAKLCVVLTLFLILIGAIVTTAGAGMAALTAPHVEGTLLNPTSPVTNTEWYKDPALFKEHTHRLVAISLGLAVGALTALIWRNWMAFFIATALMGAAAGFKKMGVPDHIVAHLRIWPAMIVFITLLITMAKKRGMRPGAEQWMVLVAYVMACAQALFGTLRVELETWGYLETATNIRTFHGVFAQAFLALLVVLAARLSPVWRELRAQPSSEHAPKFRSMGIGLLGMYFVQLALAAYLRHRGLGLLIPVWPQAQANGEWLPAAWTHAVGIHFLHSRVMPFLIAGHTIGLAIALAKRAPTPRLSRVGWLLLGLVTVQIVLGAFVIWKGRLPHITNTHVITGALICAATALLIARTRALLPARA